MTSATILVFFALALARLVWSAVRGRAAGIDSIDSLPGRTRPLDCDAFRNLADPADEDFLRSTLNGSDYRRIQRKRTGAMLDYLARAAQNASILLRIGEVARTSPDPAVAAAGRRLATAALEVRIRALTAMGVVFLRGVFLRSGAVAVAVETYDRMKHDFGVLAVLQRPQSASSVADMV
jgi:hypothetical protein